MATDLSDTCVVHMVENDDLDHDCAEHQVVDYHAADGIPTSERCPGPLYCLDCQDVLSQKEGFNA